jgi:hypothetical protein
VLVPNQDYKKLGLRKAQLYDVLKSDRTQNTITLQDSDGKHLTVNPALFEKKSVYQAQQIEIAVGDRLRWTQNNRRAGIRNGQVVQVTGVDADGIVQTVDLAGKSFQVSLKERQYIDYAYVSTIYSSQGKTGDRVLAFIDDKTISRESFYVAVSRAKHHLTLYTADIAALSNQVQCSKAKENVSDYIPLFQKVPSYAQTSKTQIGSDCDRNERPGESTNQPVQQQITATLRGNRTVESPDGSTGSEYPSFERDDRERSRTAQTADRPIGADHPTVERDVAAFAKYLDESIEPISAAIADYLEQQELLGCTGDFAAAVEAIDLGFECLEQTTENRNRWAEAVDRLDAAVRREAERTEFGERGRSRSGIVASESSPGLSWEASFYQQAWQKYSQEVQDNHPRNRDYLVVCRAFQEGWKLKDIGRMLIMSSPYVRTMHWEKGKKYAREYVNQMMKTMYQREQKRQIIQKKALKQLEIE